MFSWWWGTIKYIDLNINVRKRTFEHVCSAKIQISLRIRTVWPESSLGAFWGAKDENFLHVDNDDWWECADAEADLSLRCAYVRRHVAAHFYTMTNKKSAAPREMGLQGYMNSKDPDQPATLYNPTRPDSGLFYTLIFYPSRHTTLKWRRINVDATWSRRIDVDTTSFWWCVLAGTVAEDHVRGKNEGPWAVWSAYAVCKCPKTFAHSVAHLYTLANITINLNACSEKKRTIISRRPRWLSRMHVRLVIRSRIRSPTGPALVCVEVLRPSQPNGVMSNAVSLHNHTFTGQA